MRSEADRLPADSTYDPVDEARRVRDARIQRAQQLTVSERLEQLHHLCRELAQVADRRPLSR
jgi:hypothetical protein